MATNNRDNNRPMNRYSQHARRAVSYARLLAKAHAHVDVDSTHVLLGILHEQGSIGCNILHDLQMDLRRTERAFAQLPHGSQSGSQSAPAAKSLPFTAELQEAVSLAGDESHWLGQHYVGTEHLLLGLARSNEESLLALLHMLEISPEQIRRRVRRLLQEGITEINLEQAKRVARLSELSRRVLNGAEQLAEQMGHKQVGLAHLLLILARERRSVCAQLLRESMLDDQGLETQLGQPRPATGGMLDDIIDRAVDRAESFGSHYTGTDHLLLTIALDPRGARLLRKHGANPPQIVDKLRSYLTNL